MSFSCKKEIESHKSNRFPPLGEGGWGGAGRGPFWHLQLWLDLDDMALGQN